MTSLWQSWKQRQMRGLINKARKRRKVRVALLGWYGSPNVGDEAELTAILHLLRGDRDMTITIMSTNPQVTKASHPAAQVVSRSLFGTAAWRTLMSSRALVLGGGGLLQDRSSIYNMPSFVAYILVARLFGKKVMLWGMGAEPLATGLGRWWARLAIRLSHVVTLRDEASADILRLAHAQEAKLHVTTDPALHLEPASTGELAAFLASNKLVLGREPAVAFCLRKPPDDKPGFHLGYFLSVSLRERLTRSSPKAGGRNAYFTKLMANLADHIAEQHGANIFFVPFWGGRDDEYAGKIVAQMRHQQQATVVKGVHPPQVLKALLGQMDMVVAMRLHSAIFAAGQGVPPLGIAYASKVRGFMQAIDMEQYSIGLEQIDWFRATSKADQMWADRPALRQQIVERVAALRADSNERELLRGLLKLK